jgi:cell volume regulation protein A
VQGWTIAVAAHRLHIALPRIDRTPRRVELDLPGQLAQELVGYPVSHNSPYLRRRLIPSWAKPTLVVRDEQILTPDEAGTVIEDDYIYLLAPPERAQSLDRFFVDTPGLPDLHLFGVFFVPGDVTLGALAEVYGVAVIPEDAAASLASYFAARHGRVKQGDTLPFGAMALVAHTVADGKVTTVGLRLADSEPTDTAPKSFAARARQLMRRFAAAFGWDA